MKLEKNHFELEKISSWFQTGKKNPVHQTRYFKLENWKIPVEIDRGIDTIESGCHWKQSRNLSTTNSSHFFHCSWYKLCQLFHFTDEESVELGASPTILNPKRMYVSCTIQMPAATNFHTEEKSKPQYLAIYAHIAG